MIWKVAVTKCPTLKNKHLDITWKNRVEKNKAIKKQKRRWNEKQERKRKEKENEKEKEKKNMKNKEDTRKYKMKVAPFLIEYDMMKWNNWDE